MKKALKNTPYNIAACGGTFDLFHEGHRAFLRFAISHCDKLIIGLTSDEYIKKYKASLPIASYRVRYHVLKKFLEKEQALQKVSIIAIHDIFGPTLTDDLKIQALIVSEGSKTGANIINRKRIAKGLAKLPVVIFPMVKKNNQIISSTAIRQTLLLPEKLRNDLKKPFGQLIKNPDLWLKIQNIHEKNIITVGDFVTKFFLERGFIPFLSVVDFHIARKRQFQNIFEHGFSKNAFVYKVVNPAGTIAKEVWETVASALQDKKNTEIVLQVDGEEDLLVLPLVLLLPAGKIIFYGQPMAGMVAIAVSEKTKNEAKKLLEQFEKSSKYTRGY